jgi:hypothetical protein
MSLTKLSVAITVALGMLGTSARAGDLELDALQISGLFPGQYEGKVKGYKIKFAGDTTGRLVGRAFGREDSGTWFIEGNKLCVSWRQWTKGRPKCGSIAQRGRWLVANNNNGEMLRFRASN